MSTKYVVNTPEVKRMRRNLTVVAKKRDALLGQMFDIEYESKYLANTKDPLDRQKTRLKQLRAKYTKIKKRHDKYAKLCWDLGMSILNQKGFEKR